MIALPPAAGLAPRAPDDPAVALDLLAADLRLAACAPIEKLWTLPAGAPALLHGRGREGLHELARCGPRVTYGSAVLLRDLPLAERAPADVVARVHQLHPRNSAALPPDARLWVKVRQTDTRSTYAHVLTAAVLRTTGPVLEIGASHHSTPLLSEICRAQGRHLVTVDARREQGSDFADFEAPHHHVECLRDLSGALRQVDRWAVVLLLPAPARLREEVLAAVRGGVDYVVAHDVGPDRGLDAALASMRYRRDFREYSPATVVASDAREIW